MKDRMRYIAISSFVKGMGSILDLSSVQLNETINEICSKSDVEALGSDWRTIGKDLSITFKNYGNSIKGKAIENFRG